MPVILLHRESAVSILTITLHPAIDRVLRLRRLRLNDAAWTEIEMIYGDGKGNNVVRALTRLGVAVTASGYQGSSTGDFITRRMNAEGIQTSFIGGWSAVQLTPRCMDPASSIHRWFTISCHR